MCYWERSYNYISTMPAFREEKGTSFDHVVAGVTSRCVTEGFMSPFNLVKVRLQENPNLARGYGSIGEAFWHVTKEEGLYGIYRGLPPRLLWTAPLAAFTFLFVSSPGSPRSPVAPLDLRLTGAKKLSHQSLLCFARNCSTRKARRSWKLRQRRRGHGS